MAIRNEIHPAFRNAMQIAAASLGVDPVQHSPTMKEVVIEEKIEKAQIYGDAEKAQQLKEQLNKKESDPHILVNLVPGLVRDPITVYLCTELLPVNLNELMKNVEMFLFSDSELALMKIGISRASISKQIRRTLINLLNGGPGQFQAEEFITQVQEAREEAFASSAWYLLTPPSGTQLTRMERVFSFSQQKWNGFSLKSKPWYCANIDKAIYLEFSCTDVVNEEWTLHEEEEKGI